MPKQAKYVIFFFRCNHQATGSLVADNKDVFSRTQQGS